MQTDQIKAFINILSVMNRKDPRAPFRYKAQWIARGTGTELYTSKVCATEAEARSLAMRYLSRSIWLCDTTNYGGK